MCWKAGIHVEQMGRVRRCSRCGPRGNRVRQCPRHSQLSPPPPGKRSTGPGALSPPIGASLPDEAVVHVVSKGVGCSGTLITNHLVAHRAPLRRRAIDRGRDPREGSCRPTRSRSSSAATILPWGTVKVRAHGRAFLRIPGGHGDIAVLVLSRKLVGLSMMRANAHRIRLASARSSNRLASGRCPLVDLTASIASIAREDPIEKTRAPARSSPRRRSAPATPGPGPQPDDRRSRSASCRPA